MILAKSVFIFTKFVYYISSPAVYYRFIECFKPRSHKNNGRRTIQIRKNNQIKPHNLKPIDVQHTRMAWVPIFGNLITLIIMFIVYAREDKEQTASPALNTNCSVYVLSMHVRLLAEEQKQQYKANQKK